MSYGKKGTKKVCVAGFSAGLISSLEFGDSVERPAHQTYLTQVSIFESERGETMHPFILAYATL